MHELYELKEALCKELEEYGGKGKLTAGDVQTVDTLAHAVKNLDKIMEADEYSSRYYDGDHSYARRRDSRGRYSGNYRDGYSRNHDGYSMDGADMAKKLRTMADEMDKM